MRCRRRHRGCKSDQRSAVCSSPFQHVDIDLLASTSISESAERPAPLLNHWLAKSSPSKVATCEGSPMNSTMNGALGLLKTKELDGSNSASRIRRPFVSLTRIVCPAAEAPSL